MSIDEKAIINHLITCYYSLAMQVPDALGVLENAQLGSFDGRPSAARQAGPPPRAPSSNSALNP